MYCQIAKEKGIQCPVAVEIGGYIECSLEQIEKRIVSYI